jgi:hypothetical protein
MTGQSPLAVAVRKPKARWVRPEVLVEVAFPNASADGRLRHPSFKGFRGAFVRAALGTLRHGGQPRARKCSTIAFSHDPGTAINPARR